MRSVAEHLGACLEAAGPLEPLGVDLASAIGCVLAQNVVARGDLPQRDLAGSDGYACAMADLDGKSLPLELTVAEDVGVGVSEPVHLLPGTAIRLASGAPVPIGSDVVVPAEYTDLGAARVKISKMPQGMNIRKRAEDVLAGDILMEAGERVGARQVALLAACGYGRLPVHPTPRVVVVSIGSELVEPGEAISGGQVYDANSHALAAAVTDAGGMVYRVAAADDESRPLRELLEDQLVRADLVITTGGLGYGANDTVKEALGPLGTVRFDNVAMAPGRQLGLGHLGASQYGHGTPIFCLPGHPIAALIAFEVFVRPVLRKMAGHQRLHRLSVRAKVNRGWESPAGRRQFVCVHVTGDLNGYIAEPVGEPNSALMSSFARANGLAVVPEDISRVYPGYELPVLLLDR